MQVFHFLHSPFEYLIEHSLIFEHFPSIIQQFYANSYFGCQRKSSKYFRKGFFKFPFNILFHLGGNKYGIPCGTVVTGILDMRLGKHNLHFLVDVELLPHALVNIPNDTIHIGVFLLHNSYNIYLFLVLFLLECNDNHY
jgi:hypothetical protein